MRSSDNKDKKKLKLIFCVVLTAGIIFIIWLFIFPRVLSIENNNNKSGLNIINEDTKEILYNIKEGFKMFGSKIEEITTLKEATTSTNGYTTSTEGYATSTEESIERLKEKILETAEQ